MNFHEKFLADKYKECLWSEFKDKIELTVSLSYKENDNTKLDSIVVTGEVIDVIPGLKSFTKTIQEKTNPITVEKMNFQYLYDHGQQYTNYIEYDIYSQLREQKLLPTCKLYNDILKELNDVEEYYSQRYTEKFIAHAHNADERVVRLILFNMHKNGILIYRSVCGSDGYYMLKTEYEKEINKYILEQCGQNKPSLKND